MIIVLTPIDNSPSTRFVTSREHLTPQSRMFTLCVHVETYHYFTFILTFSHWGNTLII